MSDINRRDFLASSVAAGIGGMTAGAGAQAPSKAPQYYELRRYELRTTQRQRFSDFLRDAAVPAYNRAGVEPVGVFSPSFGPESPSLYLLLTYDSLDEFGSVRAKLQADAEFREKGAAVQGATSSDPAFMRMDSQLMIAFQGMPTLEKPAGAAAGQGRVFELRTYESHSLAAHRKKVEMFDVGEIAIFRKTGLAPVFFGSNLVGPRLPSLTYLLVFENMAARDANWQAFVNDPDWKALRSKPGYEDSNIVSNITSFILRPTPFSQI